VIYFKKLSVSTYITFDDSMIDELGFGKKHSWPDQGTTRHLPSNYIMFDDSIIDELGFGRKHSWPDQGTTRHLPGWTEENQANP
jgi:hypothetical protein